jgi:hypothetical protein
MLPTCLFILHVEPADGGSSRKNLAFGAAFRQMFTFATGFVPGTPFPAGEAFV